MTLAGWGWLTLAADRAGLASEVYVADSRIRYLAPLFEDLRGHAWLRPDQDWPAIVRTLAERRRTSATMLAEVRSDSGAVAATMEARYALRVSPLPLAAAAGA
jgi:thioesterase domain-containing protein